MENLQILLTWVINRFSEMKLPPLYREICLSFPFFTKVTSFFIVPSIAAGLLHRNLYPLKFRTPKAVALLVLVCPISRTLCATRDKGLNRSFVALIGPSGTRGIASNPKCRLSERRGWFGIWIMHFHCLVYLSMDQPLLSFIQLSS